MIYHTCTRCLVSKPITRFSTNGGGNIKSQCKHCRAEISQIAHNKQYRKTDFTEIMSNWKAA